mmetsp:Transcript_2783/g.7851  ORF Transcript_2783/g.7851 Transcript_2783/m.7851 type:complete len:272 (+) Transcript_2783:278-1093(+)
MAAVERGGGEVLPAWLALAGRGGGGEGEGEEAWSSVPRCSSGRRELMATRRVEPSWMATPTHRGSSPAMSGREVPAMARPARTKFCRTTWRVKADSESRKGSADTPAPLPLRMTPSAAAAAMVEGVAATARPTSAPARAAASLLPSPTIITAPPWLRRSSLTSSSLSSGRRSARTSSGESPNWLAIQPALKLLSPDSMAILPRLPRMLRRAATEALLLLWIRSRKRKACTARVLAPACCTRKDSTSPASALSSSTNSAPSACPISVSCDAT